MRCLRAVLLGAGLLVAGAAAQDRTGSIAGAVTDPAGAVIAGARVTATNVLTKEVRRAAIDSQGQFTLPGLLPGRYLVEVSAAGLQPVSREATLADGGALALDFRLAIKSVSEAVEVSERAYVETSAVTATKLETPLRDVPQSVQIVTRKLLDLLEAFQTFFDAPLAPDGRTVNRMIRQAAFPEQWQYLDTNLAGSLATGPVKHEVVFGFEGGYQRVDFLYDWWLNFAPTDLYVKTPPISLGAADDFLRRTPVDFTERSVYRAETKSGYAQDLVTLAPGLKALVGVRFDSFTVINKDLLADSRQKQTVRAASPRAGLVFQPSGAVSLYFSYSRSLGRSFPGRFTATDQVFEPLRGEQYEAGVKVGGFGDRLTSTLAVYHLVNRNLPASDPNNPGFSIQTGKQRSKGVELDVAAAPWHGLNLVTNYAFTQPQITSGESFRVGNLLPNAARHAGGIWATYEVPAGGLRGLGFGGGVQVVSKRFINLANDISRSAARG